jgi:Fungal cellulose binding domain
MKKATTTTAAAAPAAPAVIKVSTGSSSCIVGDWKQCGGEGYSGCTQCGKGFYCMPLSWNWHQCINN